MRHRAEQSPSRAARVHTKKKEITGRLYLSSNLGVKFLGAEEYSQFSIQIGQRRQQTLFDSSELSRGPRLGKRFVKR